MGALTVRNLTYLAVGLCVFALIYLIRQSIDKKNAEQAKTGMTTSMGDSTALAQSLGGSSPATDEHLGAGTTSGIGSTAAPNTTLVKPVTPTAASTTTVRTAPSGGGSSTSTTVADVSPQNHTKQGTALAPKGGAAGTKTTASDNKTYTTAGDKGDFWVVAGSFKDADGANARVAELKKKGFAYATAVKDATSGNTRVVAAKFPYNGGAEAEVRNLKKQSIDAFVSKQ
jgi:cell division septation protein DedD